MSKEENQSIKIKGLVRWASVPHNPARKPGKDYINPLAPNNSTYSVEVECDAAKFAKLQKMGIPALTKLREDEETGKTYLKVNCAKVKRVDGEDLTFGDPFVVDRYGKHFPNAIGNGSECIVVVELATLKKGKALRLKGVQVLNHIPYVPTGGVDKYKDLLEIEESTDDDEGETAEGGKESLDDFL